MCVYSITAVISKVPATPDTIASVVTWSDMINATPADLATALVTFDTTYDPNKVGDYVVDLTYTWGTPLQTTTRTFTAKLEDECVFAISQADKTATYYVGGADTFFQITPAWIGSLGFCGVTMSMTLDTGASMFTYTSSITLGD